jgi:hypothetical protein
MSGQLFPEAAEPFRIACLQYHDWPAADVQTAETFAILVELGVASFDPGTETFCLPMGKLLGKIADGTFDFFSIEQVLYFSEAPNLDLKWKPAEQGLMSIEVVEGKEQLVPMCPGPFKFPSLEEFNGE